MCLLSDSVYFYLFFSFIFFIIYLFPISFPGAFFWSLLTPSFSAGLYYTNYNYAMPPKIEVSDEEIDAAESADAVQEDISQSDLEELSDIDIDDDDADVQEEDVEEEEEDEDEDAELPLELDGYESEEAYQPETAAPTRPLRGSRPVRETRKRQLTFYDEDDLESEEERPKPKRAATKPKPARRQVYKEEFFEEEQPQKPDMLRMTERQRAKYEEEPSERWEDLTFAKMDEQLLALNRKTQKKKETAEQIALRKAENARRRAHYKVKQLEEEKRDTLNKLLKRRATKTREKVSETDGDTKQTLKPRRPQLQHPALSRWVNTASGSLLGVAE